MLSHNSCPSTSSTSFSETSDNKPFLIQNRSSNFIKPSIDKDTEHSVDQLGTHEIVTKTVTVHEHNPPFTNSQQQPQLLDIIRWEYEDGTVYKCVTRWRKEICGIYWLQWDLLSNSSKTPEKRFWTIGPTTTKINNKTGVRLPTLGWCLWDTKIQFCCIKTCQRL